MKNMTSRLLAFMLVCGVMTNAGAQKRDAGEWSIIPKVGVNLFKLADDKVWLSEDDSKYVNSSYKLGFEGGVDIEYMVHDRIGLTVGAMYAMQNEKYNDFHKGEKKAGSENLYEFSKFENMRVNFGFLNVPVKCNVYLTDNFALKAGVQLGFMLSAKFKYNVVSGLYDKLNPGNIIYYDADGNPAQEGSNVYLAEEIDVKDSYKHFDISIPVGFSYEYENVILEAQYRIGLSKLNLDGYADKLRSSVFSVTVGYRFGLY